MVAPRYDYTALHTITHNGVRAYNSGDGLTADAVDNLGLEVGVDVLPTRTDVIARPAGNAPRVEWATYALGQGLTVDEVDGMGRDQLRDRFPADETRDDFVPLAFAPQPDTTAEQVAGQVDNDEVPGGSVKEILDWVGDDQTKAVMALNVERGRDKARDGVIGPLEKLVAPDDQ